MSSTYEKATHHPHTSGSHLFTEPREERLVTNPDVSAGDGAARTGSGADHESRVQTLGVSYPTILFWREKYLTQGLVAASHDQRRSGRPVVTDGKQRAKVTALACSTSPQGHARWTLRLLADKAVELGYCDQS